MMTVDESLRIADGYNGNVKVGVAAPEHDAVVSLAAEVRRLREENERQHFDILAMNQSLDLLREENERLRKDLGQESRRLEWALETSIGFGDLVFNKLARGEDPRQAIDVARGAK